VDRVWFSPDGAILYARASDGRVFQTTDREHWAQSDAQPPPAIPAPSAPEPNARLASENNAVYAAAANAWKSEDGGSNWTNLTSFKGSSILGGRLFDIAARGEEIVVAGEHGVWRSADAGVSWAGLNDQLPNLPIRRLLIVPGESPLTQASDASGREWIWRAGERGGWKPAGTPVNSEPALTQWTSAALNSAVTAVTRVGDIIYAATETAIAVSTNGGQSWRPTAIPAGTPAVHRIHVDARDPIFAVAITTSRQPRLRVIRTVNGGAIWDDITANLPSAAVNGATADRATGAIYVATSRGVYMTYTDPIASSAAAAWTRVRAGAAVDVMLDAAGNQLYVATAGEGVFATMAPHRLRDPRVVSAGDRVLRAAAPGSLLSVIGARIEAARAGDLPASVLAAGEGESQVQLPFDIAGSNLIVSLTSASGRLQIGLPLQTASPAIFVDKDGRPLILNADTGLVLDAATPARSNGRIQVFATGLGRVTPAWPAGMAAPLQDAPRVIAPVRAYLDREPVEVTRATLAPGYIGMYLVEIQLPSVVNGGTAELYIEAGDGSSNRVQLYLNP
jgi:uncharacterized protein (TIGR03437 family)